MVWFVLQSFWFEYLSVPKKMERKLGRARVGRRLLQKTVGGDPHFTPADLFQTVEELARVTLRAEGRQLVVYGPFSYTNYSSTRRQEREAIRWRGELISRARALAAQLHFYFEAPDEPLWKSQRMTLHGDHFHFSAEEQRGLAEREVDLLARAVAGEAAAV